MAVWKYPSMADDEPTVGPRATDVADLLIRAAAENPDKLALVEAGGRSITWAELEDEVGRLATGLGAAVVRGAGLSVLGNMLAARGGEPAADIGVSGDCVFGDNRGELRGGSGQIAVSLAARTAIVNANRISGGEASLLLQVNPKLITVLANITSAGIVSGGRPSSTWSALGAPWEALNIRI